MQTISITVANKRATVEGSPVLVCNNTGDEIVFTFDDEWKGLDPKVARFVYTCDGQVLHQDVAFTGDTVEIPLLSNISYVHVGVYAGELSTTTAAYIPCLPSVLCGSGAADGGVIFSPDYGKFKLWNDITLAEDATIVTMSKTDGGEPLKIKHLFILFAGSTSGNGPITLRYNSGVIFQLWKSVTGDKNKVVFWVDSEKLKDALYVSYYPSDFLINDGTPDNISMQGLAQHSKSLESTIYFKSNVTNPGTQNTATSWIFGGTSSGEFKLKAGSRILVWGVQDDD